MGALAFDVVRAAPLLELELALELGPELEPLPVVLMGCAAPLLGIANTTPRVDVGGAWVVLVVHPMLPLPFTGQNVPGRPPGMGPTGRATRVPDGVITVMEPVAGDR